MRRSFSLCLAALPLWIASVASAASIVPNPVAIANSGGLTLAQVTLVGTTTGSPAFSQIGIFADPLWSSVGWIPGAGVDWTTGAFTAGAVALGQSAAIPSGSVTDVFFITVPSIDVGEVLLIAFWNGSSGSSGGGDAPATWVPEPGTLALLAGGLALLAARRR